MLLGRPLSFDQLHRPHAGHRSGLGLHHSVQGPQHDQGSQHLKPLHRSSGTKNLFYSLSFSTKNKLFSDLYFLFQLENHYLLYDTIIRGQLPWLVFISSAKATIFIYQFLNGTSSFSLFFAVCSRNRNIC